MDEDLLEFEEKNFVELAEKFINKKGVIDLWTEFVYNEFVASLPCEPPEPDDA
jgi:hypothetical protein